MPLFRARAAFRDVLRYDLCILPTRPRIMASVSFPAISTAPLVATERCAPFGGDGVERGEGVRAEEAPAPVVALYPVQKQLALANTHQGQS